ncbi:MAG: molybdenum cofactor guanylyltransferase [Nitrososphaerales archaeon]
MLAGGSSRRMGLDKAFVKIRGIEMLKRIVDQVYDLVGEMIVVIDQKGDSDKYRDLIPREVRVINDLESGQNPLLGVHSGLSTVQSKYALLIPCDTPFLNRKIIQLIFEKSDQHQAAVPRWPDGRIEPLMSVYRAEDGLAAVKKLLGTRSNSMNDFVGSLTDVVFIRTESLRRIEGNLLTFTNVNTPEDLRKLS